MKNSTAIEERNEIFDKYKYLVKNTIKKCNIPSSAAKDMTSYGYLVLIEFIDYYMQNKDNYYNNTKDEIPKSLVFACLKRAIRRKFTKYCNIYGHGADKPPHRIAFILNPKEIQESNKNDKDINRLIEQISAEEKYDFEIKDKIHKIMNGDIITQRQKEILIARFGLDDGIEKTCREDALVVGGTYQNVHLTALKAFNNIKKHCHELRELL